mgnify:CR=1 FL=1
MIVASAIAVVMATGFIERSPYGAGEFNALILFATLGMFIMSSGANLASLYVGLEHHARLLATHRVDEEPMAVDLD